MELPLSSREGRLTFAKYVISSIPLYYFSIFKCPKQIIVRLEKLIKDFLWKTNKEGRGPNPIQWEMVAKYEAMGALGLGNLASKNCALPAKWNWRFVAESEALLEIGDHEKISSICNGGQQLKEQQSLRVPGLVSICVARQW